MITFAGLDTARQFLERSVPGLPPDVWWLPAAILLILGGAAAVDTAIGIVPDLLIIPGVVAISYLNYHFVSAEYALTNLGLGIGAALAVILLNAGWFAFFRHDALGMGDAKWTMLAIIGFGGLPVLYAWGIGACLATLWILVAKITFRRHGAYVHFAPFLFVGLLIALFFLRSLGVVKP